MLEPKRKLGCCASSVECLFFILNIAVLACGAVLGGFAAYFYVNPDFPASLGMEDVRVVLAVLGGVLALLSITGMLVTAQDSHWLTRLYSFLLIIVMVMQCVGGVYLMMSQTTVNTRIQSSWGLLTGEARHAIEVRLVCCGLNAVTESPDCVASKTQTCASPILAAQTPILNLLSTTCLVFAAVEIVCLLMAQFLGGQYKNLKRKQQPQSPIVTSVSLASPKSVSGESVPMQNSPARSKHQLPESFRNNPPTPAPAPTIQTPGYPFKLVK